MRCFSPSAMAALVATVALTACSDADTPAAPVVPDTEVAEAPLPTVTPSPLVLVSHAGSSLEFWPFTGRDLTGAPVDPINLVFPGTDALSVRAALLMLDGDRTALGFPAGPPFDCTWEDAMAGNQTGYATGPGWGGSAIQLACGDYGPVRFHLRLFPMGEWTLGAAHFEVQIPGTNEHEVLSWELPEQLITADLARAGVLGAPPSATAPITPTPTYRAINPLVYNGLPAGLKALAGGPPTSSTPVPIGNDGHATILSFAAPVQGERMVFQNEFVLQFDQVIPKPFCMEGPADYVKVQGPIDFSLKVVVTKQGRYRSIFRATGLLQLVRFDPTTGQTFGDLMEARVREVHRSVLTPHLSRVASSQMQFILPGSRRRGERLVATLKVGSGANPGATLSVSCDG